MLRLAGLQLITPVPGERNRLEYIPLGVGIVIPPWNFPLAIFTGEVSAALAAGNCVLAKPAEQTSLIAAHAIRLLHEAGVPGEVLNFIPGRGSVVGQHVVADPRIAGVVFTGSTETAKIINQTLANRDGIIPALIAETGGQNAMLVDSSALPEQVVLDVIASSFNSAGQRCSALRVLFLQEEIAPRIIEILHGYMGELKIGDPAFLDTDVGPVIDADAKAKLEQWAKDGDPVAQRMMGAMYSSGRGAPRNDEYAIEEALRLKDAAGGGEVTVVALGGDASQETIRTALAMGADRGVLLKSDRVPPDPLPTARALADELKAGGAGPGLFGQVAAGDSP